MADSPRPASVRASAAGQSAASVQSISNAVPPRPQIPERYVLREKDGAFFLECDEAPRIRAIIDSGMSISRSAAASLGERVILLDGAGSFGPLLDNDAKLYNLDHHAGCERLFTLWLSDDARRLPLRIEMSTKWGRATVTLTHYDGPGSAGDVKPASLSPI